MRHQKNFNHLSRKKGHRRAMLANMASSLIIHKRINTTLAKAKALRQYVEPLITKSKNDSTHSRRMVFSYLQDKNAVTELFREVSVKVADRPGGYTRILKTGIRLGDNAEMCFIELVDYNELMLSQADDKSAKKSTRRGRRRGGSKTTDAKAKVTAEETVKEKIEDTVEEVKAETATEIKEEKQGEVEDKAETKEEEKNNKEEKSE